MGSYVCGGNPARTLNERYGFNAGNRVKPICQHGQHVVMADALIIMNETVVYQFACGAHWAAFLAGKPIPQVSTTKSAIIATLPL